MELDRDEIAERVIKATTIAKAIPLALATIENLKRLPDAGPSVTAVGKPLAGRPAFIVGAGPSLDGNVRHLQESAELGTVIAVNTAAPALPRPPSLLVSMESIDMSAHFESIPSPRALDLSANPNVWARSTDPLWWIGHGPENLRLARTLGVKPLSAGSAALCAAVSIAHEWGADPIVLVGVDLAYSDGKAYATASGWGGLTYRKADGDDDGFIFEGRQDRDELHAAHNVPAIPRARRLLTMPGWNDAPVVTSAELLDQITWLERFATRESAPRLIDATEGGAQKLGWERCQLQSVNAILRRDGVGALPRAILEGERVSQGNVDRAIDEIIADARRMERVAQECLRPGNGMRRIENWSRGCPLVEMLTAPDVIRLKDATRLSNLQKTEATYTAFVKAAQIVCERLSNTIA